MSLIFNWDARKGSLIDSTSKAKGVLTVGDGGFKKTEKGMAMKFDGSATKIELPSSITQTEGSYEIWYKSNISGVDLLQGDNGDASERMQVSTNSVFTIEFNDLSEFQLNSSQSLVGEYVHIVVIHDGDNLKLYVNGLLEDTNTGVSGKNLTISYIGSNASDDMDGYIARVQIYDNALSSDERSYLYGEFLHGSCFENPTSFHALGIVNKPTDLSAQKAGYSDADATYHATDTDCTIYHHTDENVPSTAFLGEYNEEFTDADVGIGHISDTAVDDSNFLLAAAVTKYTGHRVHIKLSNTDISEFTITAKGYGTGGGTSDNSWRMFIWNDSTSSWGTEIDSHTNGSSTTLTTTIDTDVSDYIDGDGYIYVLCMANAGAVGAGSGGYLYYFDIVTAGEATEGLVAAYNFIPQNGTLVDISGSGNHGTINGALSSKEGMVFDGVDDVITLSGISSGTSGNTLCFRGKTKSISDNIIIGDSATNSELIGFVASNYRVGFGDATIITPDSAIITDTVCDTVFVINSDATYNIYQNGSLNASGTLNNSTYNNSTFNRLAQRASSSGNFNGEINDIRIYNRAFTAQEAKDYHNSFIRPAMVEAFEDEGADEITKTPRGWTE